MQAHLCRQLMSVGIVGVTELHRALHVLADYQRALATMPVPPPYQLLVVGCAVTYLPVELWHAVVHPTVVHPHQHIGIQVIVVLQTVSVAADGRILQVAVDAERRHTELHPRLHSHDSVVKLLHKTVHVVAAPVADVADTIRVITEKICVWNFLASHRIRIEIVVDMQSVNIVAAQDVAHHRTDILTVLSHSGIEDYLVVVGKAPLRMLACHMICGKLSGGLGLGTVGVYPCVKLHATLVALVHHPLQRIPIRRRGLSLPACQETAPRLNLALIERITLGTHLKHDGVGAHLLQLIQLITQGLLHLLRAQP